MTTTKPTTRDIDRADGIGTWPSFRCGKCGQPIRNYGRKKQMVHGAMRWVGACCQAKKGAQ